MDFFIINDAIFSKLCILGDDVEPCFEGSGITSPQVSASFTLDNNFKHTLFEMMQQLTEVLNGGNKVAEIKKKIVLESEKEEDKNNQSLSNQNQYTVNDTPAAFKKEEENSKQ